MHYSPDADDHGLPHDPFLALVMPRPIGWISTLGEGGGVNLAPYSYFNVVGHRPSFVMFASMRRKDSQTNAETTGEFVANMATIDLIREVNLSSAPVGPQESEPRALGLEMSPSTVVRPPRVTRSPVALECRYHDTIHLPGYDGLPHLSSIVIGQVVSIYIDDKVIVDGIVDVRRLRPLARLGYLDYGVIENPIGLPRPTAEDLLGFAESLSALPV